MARDYSPGQEPPDEPTYHAYLYDILADTYGEDNVVNEVYLSKTGRWADFIVRCGLVTLAIEVETSSDRVVKEGLNQAQLYARHYPTWVPVVIYPPDGDNDEEIELLSEVLPLIRIPYRPDGNE